MSVVKRYRTAFSVIILCALAGASDAAPASIDEDITAFPAPAFISACTLTEVQELGNRFESVAFVYTGQIGWVIAFDKEGREHFLANSNPEHLIPFAWDFAGGIWIDRGLTFFFESLAERPFKYFENATAEEIFHLSQQSEC